MKVIFLDVDGVLNNEPHAIALHKLVEEGKMSSDEYHKIWDLPYDDTALPLKHIVEETGAKIVLSSSWRILRDHCKLLENKLREYGLEIMDKTPHGVTKEELQEAGFDYRKAWDLNLFEEVDTARGTHDRGAEIAVWLHRHPEVESFVILDDDIEDIKPYYTKEHIQTDFYGYALTMELAEKAIKILKDI